MGGVDGTEGHLSIDASYLSWAASGASDLPPQQIPLSDVLYAEIDTEDEVRRRMHATA